jgi:hypothetical protein
LMYTKKGNASTNEWTNKDKIKFSFWILNWSIDKKIIPSTFQHYICLCMLIFMLINDSTDIRDSRDELGIFIRRYYHYLWCSIMLFKCGLGLVINVYCKVWATTNTGKIRRGSIVNMLKNEKN